MRDERGFTLAELLVAIVILGLIVAAVSASLIVGLRTTDDSATRLIESHDAQLVTVYLPPDIQAASDVVASPASNSECSGGSNLLRLRWTETIGGVTTTYTAAYRLVDAPPVKELVRYFCVGIGTPQEIVVAHNVASAPDPALAGPRVSVTVTEQSGYSFTISARRRTA